MAIEIRIARTEADRQAAYRNRHIVFVEEEGHIPPRPNGRLADAYDELSATANVIALVDGQVVASLRFTKAGAHGMPASEFFDFSPFLPPDLARVGCCSQCAIQQAYRGTPLTFYLFALGYSWCVRQSLTHVICVINPPILAFVRRMGYVPLAAQGYSARKQLPFIPLILELRRLSPAFRKFIDARHGDRFTLPVDRRAPIHA